MVVSLRQCGQHGSIVCPFSWSLCSAQMTKLSPWTARTSRYSVLWDGNWWHSSSKPICRWQWKLMLFLILWHWLQKCATSWRACPLVRQWMTKKMRQLLVTVTCDLSNVMSCMFYEYVSQWDMIEHIGLLNWTCYGDKWYALKSIMNHESQF